MSWKYLITREGVKVKVDAEDYEKIKKHSWRVKNLGKPQKQSVITSLRTPKGVRTMTLGQFLLRPPKGLHVYPRRWNGGLDYRKENLIVCTMKERQRMLPKRRSAKSTSRYKGVTFIKKKNCWRARIEVDGKTLFLGDFPVEEEAAMAYNKAARKYFGSMAYQNQVSPYKKERRKKAA
ncbi:MAG: hypothetical protein D6797_00300 [Bdellovibrio sp.]|nr:MAG: hypothetical protein D6797_00300 [Bdellovibrio sp.]